MRFKFLRRSKVAAFEEAAGQRAEPQFYLVEPGAMLGRVMKNVLVFGVAQKGPALGQRKQVTLVEGHAVQARHEIADFQAAMGV